jgi:hypothetical protein
VLDEVGRTGEQHAIAGFDHGMTERGPEMRFADAWRCNLGHQRAIGVRARRATLCDAPAPVGSSHPPHTDRPKAMLQDFVPKSGGHYDANLQAWLGRPFIRGRMNETAELPSALRSPPAEELTQDAFDLLDARSRLDRQVWLALAHHRIPQMDAEALAVRTIVRNVARHSTLMTG